MQIVGADHRAREIEVGRAGDVEAIRVHGDTLGEAWGAERREERPITDAQGRRRDADVAFAPTSRHAAGEERRDGGPGVAVSQEQKDVGAEADLGVGVLAVAIE